MCSRTQDTQMMWATMSVSRDHRQSFAIDKVSSLRLLATDEGSQCAEDQMFDREQ